MFRTLNNTVRVYKNAVSTKVREIEALPGETQFTDLQPLVAGVRGKERCIDGGDTEDGIWTVGMVMGLIDDIPTCEELLSRMVSEATEIIKSRLTATAE